MGACYNERALHGSLTEADLQEQFREMQMIDRYENGHSYSGGWGQCRGLSTEAQKIFESEDLATKYLQEVADKWGPAVAVKYRTSGTVEWLIGAWCAE